MKPVIFSGPTLWSDPLMRERNFVWRPPAKDGDVYRAARESPPAIGIIDGQFESAPSVWHKEILWALARGIHVLGAASMGALRAAELSSFGMRGIGKVFRDFESGALQDDDEVAVLHTDSELGFRPLSDAMVDIRATLAKAASEGILSPSTAARLTARAKAMFYKERSWERLLRGRSREIASLARWLPANKVELKREDARALVRAMSELACAPPFQADFQFRRTYFWRQFVRTQARVGLPLP